MSSNDYKAQIARDRKAAARERKQSEIADDNRRIEGLYSDSYAFRKHAVRLASRRDYLPSEMVHYPGFDNRRRCI